MLKVPSELWLRRRAGEGGNTENQRQQLPLPSEGLPRWASLAPAAVLSRWPHSSICGDGAPGCDGPWPLALQSLGQLTAVLLQSWVRPASSCTGEWLCARRHEVPSFLTNHECRWVNLHSSHLEGLCTF